MSMGAWHNNKIVTYDGNDNIRIVGGLLEDLKVLVRANNRRYLRVLGRDESSFILVA